MILVKLIIVTLGSGGALSSALNEDSIPPDSEVIRSSQHRFVKDNSELIQQLPSIKNVWISG